MEKLYGAPEVAGSVSTGAATGIGQVTLSLCVVLLVIFGVAMLARRLRGLSTSTADQMQVLAQVSVGAKERVVILRVGDARLLLGVASGQVSLLRELGLDQPVAFSAPTTDALPARPSFASLLKKSLGR
jgi:flagellar protein FliO/FliZ